MPESHFPPPPGARLAGRILGPAGDGISVLSPYFILAVSLLVTALATLYVSDITYTKDVLRFTSAVQRTHDRIRDRVGRYTAVLDAVTAHFQTEPDVSRQGFHAYMSALDLPRNYPGFQGIGFSAVVPPEDSARFVAAQRASGVPDFRIWPEGARPEYHSIVLLEPVDERNRKAIGYDMFSESTRREAMVRARLNGAPAASGRVVLVQEIDADVQAGFLIYMPVYRTGRPPATHAGRVAALRGYVYSPFRADDFLADLFGTEAAPSLDFRIYDQGGFSDERLMHDSRRFRRTEDDAGYTPRFADTTSIQIAGRSWNLLLQTNPSFELASGRGLIPFILAGGVFISLILFGVARAEVRARSAAERIALDLSLSREALLESEARLRRLVDANIIGVTIGGLDGRVVEANDAFLQSVGYDREDVRRGRLNLSDLTPPEFRHLDARAREELRRTGRNLPFEKELIRRDGTRVPVLVGTAYLGGPEELGVSFHFDLTERRKGIEAIRRSEARIRAILETTPDGIITFDEELRIESLNPAAEGIFGYASAEAAGRPLDLFIRPLDGQGDLTFLTRADESGVRRILDARGRRRDGSTFPLDLAVNEMLVGDRRMFTAVARDITERRRAEEQVARHAGELARSNRELEQFAYVASHDLQEPLRGVNGAVKLLAREYQGRLDAEADELIRMTLDGVTRMQQLIQGLLTYSRVGTRAEDGLRRLDLTEPLQDALLNLATVIAETGAEVTHDPLPQVMADPTQMVQLFQNLIGNAVKFRSDRPPRVRVCAGREGSFWKIGVQDNGIGLDPRHAERIFHIFQRLHTRQEYPGTGIGLAVCKKIVERHGGRIWVESTPAEGATFFFTLPA